MANVTINGLLGPVFEALASAMPDEELDEELSSLRAEIGDLPLQDAIEKMAGDYNIPWTECLQIATSMYNGDTQRSVLQFSQVAESIAHEPVDNENGCVRERLAMVNVGALLHTVHHVADQVQAVSVVSWVSALRPIQIRFNLPTNVFNGRLKYLASIMHQEAFLSHSRAEQIQTGQDCMRAPVAESELRQNYIHSLPPDDETMQQTMHVFHNFRTSMRRNTDFNHLPQF